MNTSARVSHNGYKGYLTNPGCGKQGMRNLESYWWQSRMTTAGNRAEPVQLTDIRALALEIRRTYP